MNIKCYIFLVFILLISCHKNYQIPIDQNILKNDWISADNIFMFIEDSLICSNFSEYGKAISKYELSGDTLIIYSQPYYRNEGLKIFQYKIIELDSQRLKIKGVNESNTRVIQFNKLGKYNGNNLSIKSIDFSAGPCFGNCPVLDLKITDDSILYFFGYKYIKQKGLYKHKLSEQEFIKIQNKVNSICLDSFFLPPTPPDAPHLSVIVKYDNDSIHISGTINETVNFKLIALIDYLESVDELMDMSKTDERNIIFKDKFNCYWYKKGNNVR